MFKKFTILYLIVALLTITTAQSAFAGFSPSIGSGSAKSGDLVRIQAEFGRADVVEKLAELGFSVEEINSRLAQLTPEQLSGLSTDLDEIRSGGSIVGALVFVFLVIIILDLLGKTAIIIK